MTLDKIEADAKSTVFLVEHYGMDSPSQQRAYDLAKALLLVLPVVRAAMESTDSILPRHRAELLGDAWRHRIADAVDTMRAALEGK